jgi:hypothetical protein
MTPSVRSPGPYRHWTTCARVAAPFRRVRPGDTLRSPGGPRRVQHERRAGLVDSGRAGRRICSKQVGEGHTVDPLADCHDRGVRGDGASGTGAGRLARQHRRSGVLDAVSDLLRAQTPVDGHEAGAQPLRGPVEQNGFHAVPQGGCHSIPGADTQVDQAPRDGGGPLEQVCVGQALDFVDHRLHLGVTLGSGEEMLSDVHDGIAVDGAPIVTISS